MKKIISFILAVMMIVSTTAVMSSAETRTYDGKFTVNISDCVVGFDSFSYENIDLGVKLEMKSDDTLDVCGDRIGYASGNVTLNITSSSYAITYIEFHMEIGSSIKVPFGTPSTNITQIFETLSGTLCYDGNRVYCPTSFTIGYSFECETYVGITCKDGTSISLDGSRIHSIEYNKGTRTTRIDAPVDHGQEIAETFTVDGIKVTNSKNGVWSFRDNDGDTVSFSLTNQESYLKSMDYVYSEHPSATYTVSSGIIGEKYTTADDFSVFTVTFFAPYEKDVDFTADGYTFGQRAIITYYDETPWLEIYLTNGKRIDIHPDNIKRILIQTTDKSSTESVTCDNITYSIASGFDAYWVNDSVMRVNGHYVTNPTFEFKFNASHEASTYVSNNDATCEKDGTKTGRCVWCGCKVTVTDEGSKLGHCFIVVKENQVEATCLKEGGYDRMNYCMRCEKEEFIEHITIPKTEHNVVYWMTVCPATCTSNGYIINKCTTCDEAEVITVEKTAHNYGEYIIHEPTCTEKGYRVKICQDCGCEGYKQIIGEACGHTYKETYTIPATYDEEGIRNYVCEDCRLGMSMSIPKLEKTSEETTTEKATEETTEEPTTSAQPETKEHTNGFFEFFRMFFDFILKLVKR